MAFPPTQFANAEGLKSAGVLIVAETFYGLIELDDWFYLATNRNWNHEDDGARDTL